MPAPASITCDSLQPLSYCCLCRTVAEVLFTRFPQLPKYLCMDNGCNLHHFIMNREPEHFRDMHMYVDELHFRGHTHCCPAYNTGAPMFCLPPAAGPQRIQLTGPCCRGVHGYQQLATG